METEKTHIGTYTKVFHNLVSKGIHSRAVASAYGVMNVSANTNYVVKRVTVKPDHSLVLTLKSVDREYIVVCHPDGSKHAFMDVAGINVEVMMDEI